MLTQITPKFKFQDLNLFILDISGATVIKKTMIFVDSIFEGIQMAKYLKFLLFAKLSEKIYQIIQILYSLLETYTKTTFLEDFLNRDMQILICINVPGMGIDISDIKHVVP